MRRLPVALLLVALVLGLGTVVPSGNPLGTGQNLSLTIYSQNLALVNELRTMELVSGTQTVTLGGLPSELVPESFRMESVNGAGVLNILEQEFVPGTKLSEQALLRKFIGREIVVRDATGSYIGTLLALDGGIIIKERSGQVQIIRDPTGFILPRLPEISTKPALRLLISSSLAGEQPVRLTYLTQGLSWSASYTASLTAEDRMSLEGSFTVSNDSGKDYENARLQLVAGQPHRVAGGVRPLSYAPKAMVAEAAPNFAEQTVAEYHLYTLQRPATLQAGQTKRIGFLSAVDVRVERHYVYERQAVDGIWLKLSFINSKLNGLGRPLPAGIVRFYQRSADGTELFIGEDSLKHTPVDERVTLTVGRAFDLIGEWKRTEYTKIAKDRYRESFVIKLRNHKQTDVTVEVIEHLRGEWTIVAASQAYEKLDAGRIKFTVPVSAGGAAMVSYTVEYSR